MKNFITLLIVIAFIIPPYFMFVEYQKEIQQQKEFDNNCQQNNGFVIYTQHKDKICVKRDIIQETRF